MERKGLTYVKLFIARRKKPKWREPLPDNRTPFQKFYDEKMVERAAELIGMYKQFVSGTLPLEDTPVAWTVQKSCQPPKRELFEVNGKVIEYRRTTKYGEE